MKVQYVVHSMVVEPVTVQAIFEDETVTATINGLTIELVQIGEKSTHKHGHTFRFVPSGDADMQAHKDMFAVGNEVAAEFTLVNAASSVEDEAKPHDAPVVDPAPVPEAVPVLAEEPAPAPEVTHELAIDPVHVVSDPVIDAALVVVEAPNVTITEAVDPGAPDQPDEGHAV
jgi:hypothetical protein